MAMTEAQKAAFAKWMREVLTENKDEIQNAKPGVTFDVDGYAKMLDGKSSAYDGAEGKIVKLDNEKKQAVKEANDKLNDWYKAGSEVADTVVGQVGKDSKLGKIIRNKRDSMSNEEARGGNTHNPS